MVRGMKKALLVLVGMVVAVGLTPGVSLAVKTHNIACNDCHKSTTNPRQIVNFCVTCHAPGVSSKLMTDGMRSLTTHFSGADASNAMGNNGTPMSGNSGEQTSHFWGASSTAMPAAGSSNPSSTFYTSRYGISTGRVTCSICHDPHLDETIAGQEKLLRKAEAGDLICQQCHSSWFVSNTPDTNAMLTHPVVANYLTFAAANPTKFKAATDLGGGRLSTNVNNGDVRLVNGGISCTSCHGAHYTDSSSATVDGKLAYDDDALAAGDGNMLRSDGPLSLVTGTYSDANATAQAQLRSNLCQACHTYKMHGKTADGGAQIGCLDCHGGHAYNGGAPNIFILSRNVNTYAPINGGTTLTALDLMANIGGKYIAPYSKASNDNWSDRIAGGSANGYCEKCHGDVQSAPILGKANAGHSSTSNEACTNCHHHDGAGWSHSWQPDVSAATCGDCHGFPPYLNAAGDRVQWPANDGGYAYSATDTSTTIAPIGTKWNYSSHSGSFKNEAQTAHNTHAGGSTTFPDYYFVGASGTENCEVCHGDSAGFDTRHRDMTRQSSFRDVPFNAAATASGLPAPTYSGAAPWTCSNVYCHTNGGPRDNAGTQTFKAHVTPAWDQANGGGKDALLASGTRCKSCHGNDAASMVTGQENASQSHIKHLNKGYSCNVCHVDTATSNTALKAGATRGNIGGKHVNKAIDVDFDTTYNLGAGLLTVGAPYTAASGTCSVYCHSDGIATNVTTVDWQVASTGANASCTACHKGNVASGNPMISGSHGQHINGTVATIGRQMGCVECHSTTVSNDTTVSTASNHVNGLYTLGMQADSNKTTCSSVKCHSNGNLDGTITYKTLGVDYTWGSNNTIGCASCHGDGVVSYPTYANGGIGNNSNSHAAHVAGGIACGECHATVSTDGTAIDGTTPAQHVNQLIEVSGPKFTWTSGTETCSAITCHGGNSAQWGAAALTCGSCHQSATADVDDFTFGNGTQAVVYTAEWTFSGHGKTTGTYEVTGRSAANFPGAAPSGDPCKFCHDGGVTHNAANYFRLRQNGKADLNGACLGCHETGGAGVDPDGASTAYTLKNATVKVDKYHQGAKHGDPRDGGRWCWDCHDPHGDASAAGSRIQMIQKRAQVNPNAYGVPASLTGTDIVFTSRTTGAGAGGFARTAAPYAAGICNACHTTTAQYTNATGANTHTTAQCTTCHQHSKDATYNGSAFQGSGCNGCHGSTGTGQYWPDGSGGNPAYIDDSVGAHQNHILAISMEMYGLDIAGLLAAADTDAKQQAICAFCHKNPGASGHDTNGGGDNRVDVAQDSDDGAGNTDVFRKWGPAANDSASDIDGVSGNQSYNYTTGSCSNLACHDRVATPASWTTPPGTLNCSICHVAAGNGLGRHDTHVTTKGYACTECHTNVGTFPSGTTNLRHANGSVELVWNIAGSHEATYGGSSVTYTGALIYGDGNFGTCSSAACHNNLTSTAWNTAATSACTACHTENNSNSTNAVVDPTTGLHIYNATFADVEGHDASFTAGGTCTSCHNSASISGGHINGTVTTLLAGNFVNNASQTINLNGAGAADDTCTANCHKDGNTWARQWSSAAYSADTTPGSSRCNVCHGQLNSWVAGLGVNHNLPKINDSTHSACSTCHVLPDAPYVWATHHDDGNMNYNSNADLNYSTTNANCTSACHNNSAPYTMAVSTKFPTTVGLVGSGGGCTLCHGNGSSKIWPDGAASGGTETLRSAYADSAAGAHEKHVQAIGTYLGYGSVTTAYTETQQKTAICIFCHPNPGGAGHSTDSGDSIVDVLGTNLILKYNGAGGSTTDTGFGAAYGAGVCSNIACHDRLATPASWNSPPAANCSTCHVAAGSSNGRHDTHVTTKGHACTECHPNQGTWPSGTTGLQHANGTVNLAWNVAGSFEATYGGSSVTYTGGLSYGDGSFGTCASAACHNNLTSAGWNTAATSACIACHSETNANASAVVDPTSGLHLYNATYADVEAHDNFFTGGGTCTSCHSSASISGGHINGSVTTLVAGNFINNAGQTIALNGAGTADDTCTANCHIDNNKWARLWDTAAYSAATTSGSTRCNVCHGQFGNWRTGTSHAGTNGGATSTRGQTHNKLTGATNACEDCHSFTSQGASKHMNSLLTMNDDTGATGDTDVTVGTNGVYCAACHSDDGLPSVAGTHTFPATTLTVEKIAGANDPEGSCNTCHGDKTAGQAGGIGNNWPDSNTTATYPDIAGTHDEHVTVIAAKRATSGTNSCNTCHATADNNTANGTPPASHQPGTAPARVKRMDNTGDSVADLDLVSWRHLLDTGAATDADAVYNYGASGSGPKTCSNIDCHYNVTTPTWFGAVLTSSNAPETLTNSVQVRPTAGAWANEITVAAGTTIEVQGTIDDTAGGGHIIQAAHYKVDYSGSWVAMTASDGSFNSSVEGAIKTGISTTGWSRGRHIIYVQGKDATNIAYGPPAMAIVNITTPDTLNVSSYSNNGAGLPAATSIKGTHMPMMRLDMSMTNTDGQNSTTVTALTLAINGTNGVANVGLAAVYLDSDANQAFDPNVDTPIGSNLTTATPFTVTVTDTTITTATTSFFVVFQMASNATAGNTVGVSLNSVTITADDTVNSTATASATTTLQNSVSGNLLLTPSGVSSLGGWSSYVGGAASAGNEATVMDVADTTNYEYTATKNSPMTVDIDNHTTESDVITGVTMTMTASATAGTVQVVTPRIGTTAGTAINWTVSTVMTARSNPIPRPGGGSWTWADIDNLNFIVSSPNTNGTTCKVDKIEVDIAYGGVSSSAPVTYDVLANSSKSLSIAQGTSFTLTASLSDTDGGAHAVSSAKYQADTPPVAGAGTTMTGTTSATASVATSGWVKGDHWVYVYGNDATDGWGLPSAVKVNIQTADVVTLAGSSYPPPAQVGLGEKAAYLSMNFTQNGAGNSNAIIDAIKLTKVGTIPDAEVSRVAIYDDKGSVQNEWDGYDNIVGIGTFGTPAAGTATVDLLPNAIVYNGTTTRLYAVLTTSTNPAIGGTTLGVTVDDLDVTLLSPDTMAVTSPFSSATASIVAGGGAAKCGFCHTIPLASGAHLKHANTDATYTDCDNCHGSASFSVSPAVGGGYSATTPALHNNTGPGSPDMYFSRATPSSPTGAWNGTNCTNIECHNGAPTPNWVGGTATCTSCHNNGTNNGLLANAHPGTGKHTLHVNNSAYLNNCEECHGAGANSGTHNGHRNGVANFSQATGGLYLSAYASGTDDCTNTCHNVPTNSWFGVNKPWCTDCHAAGKYAPVPASGLHAVTSAMAHDASFQKGTSPTYTCESCHNSAANISNVAGASTTVTHRNGTTEASNVVDYVWVTANVTSYSQANGCAAACHNDALGGVGKWQRKWNGVFDAAPLATMDPGHAVCDNCHGDGIDSSDGITFDNVWRGGVVVNHNANPDGNNGSEIMANHQKCELCHGYGHASYNKTYETGNHGNDKITMNVSGAGYAEANWNCTLACHSGANNTNHMLSDSGRVVEGGSFGSGSCTSCHGGGTPAAGVSESSPHTTVTGYGCADCHGSHSTGTVVVPNNTALGINYTANGETGINLRDPVGSATTEAQICWNCHDAKGISEWDTNTDAVTGNSVYNYGSLSTSNWTTATWTSANFSYKTGAIVSTHAATTSTGAGTTTRSGVDDLATIRCSYCHDVHDLNKAPGDGSTGKPYLRGSWRGNAYKEDGAPQANTVYTSAGGWGGVPRADTATTQMGGFWIDANSSNPNSAVTPTQFGGLCDLCHGGTKDGVLNGTEIDALNQYGADNSAWISGYNGHKNSVKGASGAGSGAELTARNIFNTRGGTALVVGTATDSPLQNFQHAASVATNDLVYPGDDFTAEWGFRSNNKNMTGLGTGVQFGSTQAKKNGLSPWGVDQIGTTTNSNYHQFSCSKCHNPHASRLPKLMITNCLDTKHNKWDNGNSGTNATPLNPYTGINKDRSMSNWSSAQNCHRLANVDPQDTRADVAGTGAGWNKVTPWTDTDGYGTGNAPTFDYTGSW